MNPCPRIRPANRVAAIAALSIIRQFNLVSPLLVIVLAALVTSCTQKSPGLSLVGATMGTTWSVRVTDCAADVCDQLTAEINDRLQELTARLSHYEPESELSGFNNHAGTDWYAVSADLSTVTAYALQVSTQTNGAFDVTVAPAVNAWGFGPIERTLDGTLDGTMNGDMAADDSTDNGLTPPSSASIAQAIQHSGYTKLTVRESPAALRKEDPLLRLDLSALAKGYAVDQLTYLIETAGSTNYMVEIGGEIRTSGERQDGKPWRIGIQPPDTTLEIQYIVTPGNSALATSGDYRNYYMLDDQRISHTIDPASGKPVANNLASVSVIAPDTMQADALATAIMVMGPEAGMEFARENEIAVLIIERTADGTRERQTPEFESYLLGT